MSKKISKIYYLDGIRGIAAANVLLTHYIVAFFPALFTGVYSQTHFDGNAEILWAKSIFSILYSGNLAVPILFVLSAYVLSFRFFIYQDNKIATDSAYRRYPRLVIPVLFSVLLSWIMMKFSLFYNTLAGDITHSEWFLGEYYKFEPSLIGAIKQGLLECFTMGGNINYNPVLWTMNYEMIGSFTVFSFLALFGKSKKRYLIYIIMLIVFIKSYYLSFILGMILSDFNYQNWSIKIRQYLEQNQYLSWILIFFGLILGSYFNDERNYLCIVLNFKILREYGVDLFAFYHIIGATMVLLGCMYNSVLKKILEFKILQFLGRIAFSLYLIHFIFICSLGSYIFLHIYKSGFNYFSSVAISILITTPIILLFSYFMTLFIDEPVLKAVKKLQEKYFN